MSKLAIIIPAHNEEKRIGRTLNAYVSYFAKLVKNQIIENVNFIIVINNCKDRTAQVVKNYKGKNIEILEFIQGGKGFAVIEGFKKALKENYEYLGFVDADMSTSPEEFYRLFNSIGSFDGVVASRYLPGAKILSRNMFMRILASRIYNFFIRGLLFIPERDTQCGAKIFTNKSIRSIIKEIGMTQWAFDIEILYLLHKKGYSINEFPTVWANKEYSTINFWNSGPWMALAILRLRILHSPFKKMIRFYDKFIKTFKPIDK